VSVDGGQPRRRLQGLHVHHAKVSNLIENQGTLSRVDQLTLSTEICRAAFRVVFRAIAGFAEPTREGAALAQSLAFCELSG
jgi:hypothetical protein